MDENMNSILNSIKKMLGPTSEYTFFDTDIIIHINTAFAILRQLGVGPEKAFKITGVENTWDEFSSDDEMNGAVKTYIYLKVRLVFDPPTSSVLAEAIKNNIAELEWRLKEENS